REIIGHHRESVQLLRVLHERRGEVAQLTEYQLHPRRALLDLGAHSSQVFGRLRASVVHRLAHGEPGVKLPVFGGQQRRAVLAGARVSAGTAGPCKNCFMGQAGSTHLYRRSGGSEAVASITSMTARNIGPVYCSITRSGRSVKPRSKWVLKTTTTLRRGRVWPVAGVLAMWMPSWFEYVGRWTM